MYTVAFITCKILPGILCAAGCTAGDGIVDSYYAPRPSYSYTATTLCLQTTINITVQK